MAARLKVVDLTPAFLTFYDQALNADPETRWGLWNQHYGYAAVPPTEEGKRMARRLLDQSFDRYPEALTAIRAGAAGYPLPLQQMLDATAAVLQFDRDLEIQVTLFVGNFEGNAFAANVGGKVYISLPVESRPELRPALVPHELAHALHMPLSNAPEGWLRSVAMSAMQEGIAIWTSMAVVPGRPEVDYIAEEDETWVQSCRERERLIVRGMRPHLAEVSHEALMRFVMGPGPSGLRREVYWAGYRAVGRLLEQGWTLAQLARLQEAELVPALDHVLAELAG